MMRCEVNNVPIPQTNFNVRSVLAVRPSSTFHCQRWYNTEDGLITAENGLKLKFVCGIGTLIISYHTEIFCSKTALHVE